MLEKKNGALKLTRFNLTVSCCSPSSSSRESVEKANAFITHTYGMISPIKSKLQWVWMSPVLRKSFLYIYANNKVLYQTAQMCVLIRIFFVRCCDNFKGSVYLPYSNIRMASETKQSV